MNTPKTLYSVVRVEERRFCRSLHQQNARLCKLEAALWTNNDITLQILRVSYGEATLWPFWELSVCFTCIEAAERTRRHRTQSVSILSGAVKSDSPHVVWMYWYSPGLLSYVRCVGRRPREVVKHTSRHQLLLRQDNAASYPEICAADLWATGKYKHRSRWRLWRIDWKNSDITTTTTNKTRAARRNKTSSSQHRGNLNIIVIVWNPQTSPWEQRVTWTQQAPLLPNRSVVANTSLARDRYILVSGNNKL